MLLALVTTNAPSLREIFERCHWIFALPRLLEGVNQIQRLIIRGRGSWIQQQNNDP